MFPPEEKSDSLVHSDVQISRIHTVYYGSQTDWSRPAFTPRYTNGLIYLCEGSIRYQFEAADDRGVLASVGDILLFPKGTPYRGVSLTPVNSFYVIDFETASPQSLSSLCLPFPLHPPRSFNFEQLFRRIQLHYDAADRGGMLLCRAQIYELLYRLVQYAQQTGVHAEQNFVRQAMDYIRADYARPDLYIGQIADAVYVSESQLRRAFSQVLHQSPSQFLLAVRMEHAKNLLLYSRRPVCEIAERCGFSSFYYFCRVFRQQTGLTPSQYRRL